METKERVRANTPGLSEHALALSAVIDRDYLDRIGSRARMAIAVLDKNEAELRQVATDPEKLANRHGEFLVDELAALLDNAEGLAGLAKAAIARLAVATGLDREDGADTPPINRER